jgi:hypothetical protein
MIHKIKSRRLTNPSEEYGDHVRDFSTVCRGEQLVGMPTNFFILSLLLLLLLLPLLLLLYIHPR